MNLQKAAGACGSPSLSQPYFCLQHKFRVVNSSATNPQIVPREDYLGLLDRLSDFTGRKGCENNGKPFVAIYSVVSYSGMTAVSPLIC